MIILFEATPPQQPEVLPNMKQARNAEQINQGSAKVGQGMLAAGTIAGGYYAAKHGWMGQGAQEAACKAHNVVDDVYHKVATKETPEQAKLRQTKNEYSQDLIRNPAKDNENPMERAAQFKLDRMKEDPEFKKLPPAEQQQKIKQAEDAIHSIKTKNIDNPEELQKAVEKGDIEGDISQVNPSDIEDGD